MCRDTDPRDAGQDDQDDAPASRRVPLTTIGLCGLGMILLGCAMRLAAAAPWWVLLVLAAMLLLVLFMGMVQERWLTRERHRLVVSALKRTGAPSGSAIAGQRQRRRTRTRRGGKQ